MPGKRFATFLDWAYDLLVWLLFALAVSAVIGALWPQAAAAQASNCAPYRDVVDHLASGWGEYLQTVALTPDSTVLATFANTVTGSWTMTVTDANGTTCLIAAGTGFELVATPMGVPG